MTQGVDSLKSWKGITVLLAAMMVLAGCGKKNMQTDVTLQVGELWEITEESIFETADTTFQSQDSTIATLRSGKYIYGGKAGETTIQVQNGERTQVFHVTVLPDENIQEYRTGGTWGEEPENALLIGYGFNALENEDCNMQTINQEAGCMFDWQSVLFSGNLTVDSSVKTTANAYTGSSLRDFCNSYKTKDSVPQTFSMFDRNMENQKTFKGVNITQSSLKSINQAYYEISKARYMFTEDADGYFSYLLPEVQDALMGFDGTTAEEFIRKYGTHILVGGSYGVSFEYTYVISNELTSTDKYSMSFPGNGNSARAFLDNIQNYIQKSKGNTAISGWSVADTLLEEYARPIYPDIDARLIFLGVGTSDNPYSNNIYDNFKIPYTPAFWAIQCVAMEEIRLMDTAQSVYHQTLLGAANKGGLVCVWDLIPRDGTPETENRYREFLTAVQNM